MSKYQAIIFDLDGTLVDTISLYEKAFMEVLRNRGHKVTVEGFRDWYIRGVHLREIAEMLDIDEHDIPQIRIERDALYEELLRTETMWLPGATIALAAANANGPVGIVTGSWLSYLKAMRARTDVFPYAKTIVTADDIHMVMKPHPQGLILCAERLKIDPRHCAYIGDQKFDMDAAKAAGMAAILVSGSYTPKDAEASADIVLESLKELLPLMSSTKWEG
jgi:phosphoglycolate phosphatase